MSEKPYRPPKSPFQSQRTSIVNEPRRISIANEPSVRVPSQQESLDCVCPPNSTTPQKQIVLNTPTRPRSAAPTAGHPQKQLVPNTPTNSTVCIPRDKPSPASTPAKTPNGGSTFSTPQRPLSARDKPSAANTPTNTLGKTQTGGGGGGSTPNTPQRPLSARNNTNQFNPVVTSTPRVSQMKTQQASSTVGNNQKRPQPQAQPHNSTVKQPQRPVVPVQPLCKCVPIRNLTSEFCSPKEPSGQPPDKGSDGVKTDRILKLEILSVRGGSLYNVDRMHQPPVPEYDPCYDIDPMVVKPASEGTGSESRTSGSEKRKVELKDRKPTSVKEDDEDTVVPRSSEDESTLHRETDTTLTSDTSSSEPTGAPKKQVGLPSSDDSDDVMRSAPAIPARLNLSEVSLPDMPPAQEGNEDVSAGIPKPSTPGIRSPPGLGDDSLPVGDVSLPMSDLSGMTNLDDSGLSKTITGESRETGQADNDQSAQRTGTSGSGGQPSTDDGRRSISLMLGPSVRNFARLAVTPLVALRTFLGPASSGRPEVNARHARKKRSGRYHDEHNSSENGRIRSVRSAVVVTPYEATVSSLALLLRSRDTRRNTMRSIRTDTSQSAESSEEE